MKRVDAPGFAPGNLYTNGNPSLSIAATTVDDSALNAIQEEIVAVVLDAGLTLDQTNVDLDQLLEAINAKVAAGGVQLSQAIVNNQAAPADVTGMLFASGTVKSVVMDVDMHRQSDTGSSELDEKGQLFVLFDPVAGSWRISFSSVFDDAGVVFTVTAAGQVRYTSTNIAGSNSVGTLRYTIQTIKQ